MNCLFRFCESLETATLTNFSLAENASFREAFRGCIKLNSFAWAVTTTQGDNTNFESMFLDDTALRNVTFSSTNDAYTKPFEMKRMFYGCTKLNSLDTTGLSTASLPNNFVEVAANGNGGTGDCEIGRAHV